MSDHIDRAAQVISDHRDADDAALALETAGLLVTPAHDAEVAAKALRIVESVCMNTDGGYLEGESDIPAGEVMRMINDARELFGEGSDDDA